MDSETARGQALDAAGTLFYSRGIQNVGMDDIRRASGLSLKRLYELFGAKDSLAEAYLEHRDRAWLAALTESVDAHTEPEDRILAVFGHLHRWFAEPGFRGCAWINANGELGGLSPGVAERARTHKSAFRDYLGALVADAGLPESLADQLRLLAEGAMATAGIFRTQDPALQAGAAAATLLTAARRPAPAVTQVRAGPARP